MNRTAFYDIHRKLGGKIIEFAGWEMPVQYSSIRNEHMAVRERVGIFDVSHMGDFIFKGEGASDFIKGFLPFDFTTLEPGQEFYSHILDENGIIQDDTIVMRLEENEYLLVPNAATTQKIHDHVMKHLPGNVVFEDRSMEMQCIALQGPKAPAVLGKLTEFDLSSIEFFNFSSVPIKLADGSTREVIVSASGYTGEAGYELYTDRKFGPIFWDMIMEAGAPDGIEPCGLGCRDTLRLEKGFLLSGTDFHDDRTSLETSCDWMINWDHEFIGKSALLAQKEKGGYHTFTGFILKDKGIPRHGMDVVMGGERIGTITSGTMSPVLDTGIALGYVDPAQILEGSEVEIDIRGNLRKAEVKKPPLV